MAKVNVIFPDEFLKKLSSLGNKTDEVARRALTEGGEIVLAETKTNLTAVIGRNTKSDSKSTGQLINALGLTRVLIDKNGNYNIKVGFDEYRRDGSSNAKVAKILEYGKHGQPAKPFLNPAKTKSKDACIEKMKQVIEEEFSKL